MKNQKKAYLKPLNALCRAMFYILVLSVVFNFNLLVNLSRVEAQAAVTNLIKNGSFESDIDLSWKLWTSNASSTRQYELYRSFDAPFGQGSYSAAIDAKGMVESRWSAGLVSDNVSNTFPVTANKNYNLIFYSKGVSVNEVSVQLEDANSFAAITNLVPVNVTSDWTQHIVSLTPTASVNKAVFTFMFGDLPDGGTLMIDGVQLIEADFSLATTEVRGYIGETNKTIRVNNVSFFSVNDIDIELPYYDNQTGTAATKKFKPEKISGNDIYFNMYERTFAGIASIYVNSSLIGRFNYIVLPKVTSIYPTLMRADEDVTIIGSGFSPITDTTYAVLNTADINGRRFDTWIKPHTVDSNLTQITLRLPLGIVSGRLYVQTAFRNLANQDIINKSTSLNYKVKPIIFSLEWSKRGFEQVGDKLTIYGKGIINAPQVIFYDTNNNLVAKNGAKVKNILNQEIIEVATPDKMNSLNVTVICDGIESDHEQALSYSAKPRLFSLIAKNSRRLNSSGEVIAAAKIGETITINGQGFTSSLTSSVVEFQGNGSKINAIIQSVDASGRIIKVTVPAGAQNGSLAVITNGQKSNYLPLEIIPTILSISPNPVEPGQFIQIRANGVGGNVNLTSVYFKLANDSEIKVMPFENSIAGAETFINIKSLPLAISNQYTNINIQYENWRDDGKSVLTAQPHITDASIDLDDKTLIIRGYGFSIKPVENVITYKYADAARTIITPKVRMLGVFSTEQGQEIRVQILDNYYYGYVTVSVNGQISNEANFGPVQIRQVSRRIEYVKSLGKVMGVLYINGYNFGSRGGVKVGDQWAETHYRSEFFIIAVIDQQYVYNNPIIVTKE